MRALRNLALPLIVATSPLAAEEVTLVALGDSLTSGYGVDEDEGFVPQLQDWLNRNGAQVTLVNAGVAGDTTAGGLTRIEWTLDGAPDADALIVALGGNDYLMGLPPETVRANLSRMLGIARSRDLPVLLVGLEVPPGNLGPAYKVAFDSIFPDLGREYGALVVPDFFGPLQERSDRKQAMREYMQPDGIHPNARGVELIVSRIGPKVIELLDRANGG